MTTDDNPVSTPDPTTWPRREHLELVSWLVAIGAAMLPAMGFLIRVIAFQLSGVPTDRGYLAASTSISQLAATGANALIGPGFLLFLAAVFVFLFWRRTERLHTRSYIAWRRAPARIVISIAILILLSAPVLLFLRGFPFNLLLPATGLGVYAYIRFIDGRGYTLSIGTFLPALFIVMIGVVTYGGLLGDVPGTAANDYAITTSSTTTVVEEAQQLASDGAIIYLRSCSHNHEVVGMNSTLITHVSAVHTTVS